MSRHDVNKNIYVLGLFEDVDTKTWNKFLGTSLKSLEQWEVEWNDKLQQSKGV